jgi:hypothetical protein
MAKYAEDAAFFMKFIKGIRMVDMGNIRAYPAGSQGTGRRFLLRTVPQFMVHVKRTLSPGKYSVSFYHKCPPGVANILTRNSIAVLTKQHLMR